ncbi:MAG: choice-of-anchor J domain-containing protein [Bacteroidetes bacterium]|nr:choice-of-anchor J domain-containing protein [Bacteroidota bacterium]
MMKNLLLVWAFSAISLLTFGQNAWINEFHYDNEGTDMNEFIEIVIEDAGSYTLSDFAVTLYNGNNSGSYDTKTLDQFTVGATTDGFTFYYYDYPENGIQNGESDGICLSYAGTLIPGQFLSYEGTLTAADGPAIGITSTDIGVSESSATTADQSLQLSGTGTQYGDFVWQEPAMNTKGDLNNDQSFDTFVPDPEPTNYPTDFLAESVGMKIELTWTDAAGEQLPAGYLVLGRIADAAPPAPIDGTPVPNDTDFSNGEVALNVPFGVETCSFMVDANTPYNFRIYPYTNAGINIDYKTDGNVPLVEVISHEYMIISEENFDDTTSTWTWTPYNVIGAQEWEWASDFGNPPGCAVMNGYDGGANPNEDWLISPPFDLFTFNEVRFNFDHARNYATNDGLSVLVSNDYDGTSDPSTNGTWNDLTSMFMFPEQGSWNFVPAGDADFTPYAGMNTYLAFRYISTSSDAATWEVDNAVIYGVYYVSIDEMEETNIQIYPNPATNMLTVNCEDKGHIRVISLAGQLMMQTTAIKGTNRFIVEHLNPGLYMLQFTNEAGATGTQKLMIK